MAPSAVDSVAIVGFGLIGASLAAALRTRAPGVRITAIDLPHVASSPEARARVDELVSVDDTEQCQRLVQQSGITVLAGPVGVILSQLPQYLPASRVLTDCGSTKRHIAARAESMSRRGRFVPGHPMAGKTQRGFHAADAELFAGQPWILCPEHSDEDAVQVVNTLATMVGAQPVTMTAASHDAAVALTSHVPKLLAAVLVKLCHEADARAARGPAFERATRVADGDVGIWRDILATNADEVAAAAARLSNELSQLSAALAAGDIQRVMDLLERSGELK